MYVRYDVAAELHQKALKCAKKEESHNDPSKNTGRGITLSDEYTYKATRDGALLKYRPSKTL